MENDSRLNANIIPFYVREGASADLGICRRGLEVGPRIKPLIISRDDYHVYSF
jgi:hypothetical protein